MLSRIFIVKQDLKDSDGKDCFSCALEKTSSKTHIRYILLFSSVQSLSHVRFLVTPCTAARQASLSITSSWNLLKLMYSEWAILSKHLILCCPLLLLPSIVLSLQFFPASGSFPMSHFFASGGQSIGV